MERICRTCLRYLKIEDGVSVHLKVLENKSTLDLIQDWALIEVTKADKLPAAICKMCYENIKCFTSFMLLIRKSDNKLKQRLLEDNNNSGANDVVNKLGEKKITMNGRLQAKPINKCKGETDELVEKPSDTILNSQFYTNNDQELEQQLTETKKKSPVLYKCQKCPKIFKRSYQYKLHMTLHTGEKKYLCTICGKYFARSYVLIYHMRVHTGEKKFNCNVCDKSFIHPSNLYKHKKIHTDTRNYKCEYCSKSFVQSEALKIHMRRIHSGEKPFMCEICSKSFSSQSSLWVHKQDTHKEKETCNVCQKQFSSRILKDHVERHTNKKYNIKRFICEQCGKNFSSDHNLKQHLLSHNGIKPYASQCYPCHLSGFAGCKIKQEGKKQGLHPSNLYKHKKIHTDTRNYKCEYCSKSFVQSEALKIHMRRIHSGEKPFMCEICSKSFSSQSALWVHKQDTHKEKETCNVCQKQFSSRILKDHVERHTNKKYNIKRFICEQCGKNFSSDHNLKQHLLSHNGIKPYASQPIPCTLCEKLYSKRRIKSHICIAMKK